MTLGPLSNVGTALLICPELQSLVADLTVMGGVINQPGNISPIAEANIFNDPHAAK